MPDFQQFADKMQNRANDYRIMQLHGEPLDEVETAARHARTLAKIEEWINTPSESLTSEQIARSAIGFEREGLTRAEANAIAATTASAIPRAVDAAKAHVRSLLEEAQEAK